MVNKNKSVLQHIKKYCYDIKSFIDRFGGDYDVFKTDRAYFNAVSMCILQIGELSGSLSDDFRSETSEKIPWADIRGMRNIVAHNYGSLDEELVWETATDMVLDITTVCLQRYIRTKFVLLTGNWLRTLAIIRV